MKTRDAVTRTIAIIGGGVSGTLTAYHLLRQNADARVVVIDPRSKLGLGLAYSTPSLRHLLNVPAGKISALPDEPDHFLNWLRVNHGAEAQPTTFAPRAVFGRYIHSLAEDIGLNQVLASVVDYRANKTGAILTLDTGRELRADFVVLATGNFDPAALPGISEEAIETGAYCHNAWAPETYGKLNPDAPVALIGTGLTGVDVVLRLRELCHRGIITAISRHGVFPNRHADYEPLDESAIPPATPATCVAYLHAIHTAIQMAPTGERSLIACVPPRMNSGLRCQSMSKRDFADIFSDAGTWCAIAWPRPSQISSTPNSKLERWSSAKGISPPSTPPTSARALSLGRMQARIDLPQLA